MTPMTDQFQEQASLFVDDELSVEECEFFVRRLQRDPEARSQLLQYHLIGAALRGELKSADPDALRRRVDAALNGVGRIRETRARSGVRYARFLKPAARIAIAVSVAVIAVLALQTSNRSSVEGPAPSGALVADQQSGDATYVVPRDTAPRRLVSPPIRLTNYLMHHGEYASYLSRTSVHSNVVATGQPDVTEESEDAQQ
jgi:negative regulator of sigma E activity